MSPDLDHRITHQLDEIDAGLAALLSSRGELGTDSRRLLLALDRRLAAMAAALDDET